MATNVRKSLLCLVFALVCAIFLPNFWAIPLHFAAPALVMLLYNGSLALTMWMALVSGLFMDVVSLSPLLGFLAIVYLITCRLLFSVRLYFFKDSELTLGIMTYLFSLCAHLVEQVIGFLFDLGLPAATLSGLFIEPLCDAAFALVVFQFPRLLWQQYGMRRRRCERADT